MRKLRLFKCVIDFPTYTICSDGVVYRNGVILKTIMSRQGYSRVQLYSNGKRKLKSVSFLIQQHFKKKFFPSLINKDCPF